MSAAETLTAAANRIERVARAATPGPWKAVDQSEPGAERWAIHGPTFAVVDVDSDTYGTQGPMGGCDQADAEHIALMAPLGMADQRGQACGHCGRPR